MITITRALKLVYNFTDEAANAFLKRHELEDEDPNPFVSIEQVIPKGDNYYTQYDWFFCCACMHYEIVHLNKNILVGGLICSKCGGEMV